MRCIYGLVLGTKYQSVRNEEGGVDVVLTLLTEMEWFWNKVSEGEKFFEKKVSKYLFVSAKCITFAAGKLSKTKN